MMQHIDHKAGGYQPTEFAVSVGAPPPFATEFAASIGASPQFALPRPDVRETLSAKIAGKASRFLARNVPTKALRMRNTFPVVTFTFDDVPVSACNVGAPILERYGGRGTFYVSGGGCGATSPGGRLASADQIAALRARGHEVGCHTYSHCAVSTLAIDALSDEIERNRRLLQVSGAAIALSNFAYPYGEMSFRSKRYLETKFDSCRSLLHGVNHGTADLGALKSYCLQSTSGRRDVLEYIAQVKRVNGWLIFSCHDVQDPPSRFGVTPDLLDFAVRSERDAGCCLATIAEALALIAA